LHSRIEQGNNHVRHSVSALGRAPFAQVTSRASKTQVLDAIAALRVDVLDVHLLAGVEVAGAAVLAAAGRASVHKTTERSLR
jgi:hypothetical protein